MGSMTAAVEVEGGARELELFRDIVKHEDGRTTADLNRKLAKISKANVRYGTINERLETLRLARSIEKHGLQHRITCSPQGEIFVGKRRKEAFDLLAEKSDKWDWIPCEIEGVSIFQQRLSSYEENKERKNMSVSVEAKQLKEICEEQGINPTQLAEILGQSPVTLLKVIRVYDRLVIPGIVKEIVYGRGLPEDVRKITLNKADLLAVDWIPEDARKKLVSEIEAKGITKEKLAKIINVTKAYYKLLEEASEEEKEKMNERLGEKLFTDRLNLQEVTYVLNEVTGNPQRLSTVFYEKEHFKGREEAEEYARRFDGECFGLVEVWKLEIDAYAEKRSRGENVEPSGKEG